MTDIGLILLAVVVGTVASAGLSWMPALHAYNVLGIAVVGIQFATSHNMQIPLEVYLPFFTSFIVGWSVLNTIPAILLGAPDESAILTVLPGQKYLMVGRGFEATILTGAGSLGGLFVLVFVAGPLAPKLLPVVQDVLRPHLHWILWVVITYLIMSEWPRGGTGGVAGWKKFFDAWKGLGAGLMTFLLSAMLGFIILYRSPVSSEVAFQNIMPAFVGLFAVPWCILNMISRARVPSQFVPDSIEVSPTAIVKSVGAGSLGGGFAAFFPVITGGVGGLLAGHATAQRDEKVFIMSQGVSKLVYYTGAFMLFFVPSMTLTRGGGAWMLRSFHDSNNYYEYFMVLAAIALSGALSFLLMIPMTRWIIRLIARYDYRYVSAVALIIIIAMVGGLTRWGGLLVMVVGTGIGLLPVLFGSRRLNCLGILLLPFACNMSGFGHHIAKWLGLI